MTSLVEVANRALTKLGETRITALTDDTKQAKTINSMFVTVRDDELRANRWSFSITRAQLAADVTTPLFGYGHKFLMPTDCLRILMVGTLFPGYDPSDYRNAPDTEDWQIEGRYILRDDVGPLNVRYIRQVSDTSEWDATFVEAFACRLAAESCETLTQSLQRKDACWNEYHRTLRVARRAGAIELPPRMIADDSWVLSRVRA